MVQVQVTKRNRQRPHAVTRRQFGLITAGAGGAVAVLSPLMTNAREQRLEPTAEEQRNIEIINQFIADFTAGDTARVAAAFAPDARFSVGPVGNTRKFQSPDFSEIFRNAQSITMDITPGTTWARGPVVAHERFDRIPMQDGRLIDGRYISLFTLHDGKIVDFIDFKFAKD